MIRVIKVLDHGHVQYVRHQGTDLDVVNNARVSFDQQSTKLGDREVGIIHHLARGISTDEYKRYKQELTAALMAQDEARIDQLLAWYRARPTHWTPFAVGISATLRIKMPFFVKAQMCRTVVGFSYNEVSRRYVTNDTTPPVYQPSEWRARPSNVKQGSGKPIHHEPIVFYDCDPASDDLEPVSCELASLREYENRINSGMAPELARICLPQAAYTEINAEGSLVTWARIYTQRIDSHAQWEIQQYADAIGTICSQLWPHSWAALTQGALK